MSDLATSTATQARLDLARNAVAIELDITQMLLSIAGTHLFVGATDGPMAQHSDERVLSAVADARAHFVEVCRLVRAFEEFRATASISAEAAQEHRRERGPLLGGSKLKGAA